MTDSEHLSQLVSLLAVAIKQSRLRSTNGDLLVTLSQSQVRYVLDLSAALKPQQGDSK